MLNIRMAMTSATIGLAAMLTASAWAYDASQSTGTGTSQGAGGGTAVQPGVGQDSKSAKNEDSGSATGATRDRSQSGAEAGPSHGSARAGATDPNRDADGGRTMGQSGAGTKSGASKSRK